MTSLERKRSSRNQSIECFKFIASIIVVFLHINFPGNTGVFFDILGNVAVAIFFAISGYFNYNSQRDAVIRRIKHLLNLYLLVIVTNVISSSILVELNGGSTIAFLRSYLPDLQEVMRILVLHQSPRNAQLWYLIALGACYLFLLLYLDFRKEEKVDYRPLYIMGFSQFSVFFLLGCIANPAGLEHPYLLHFNGYYFGFCFFTFGIFLHQYEQRIIENFHLTTKKLWMLFAVGLILNYLQSISISSGQIPIGGLIEITALMLLMISHPVLTRRQGLLSCSIERIGVWSTYIYIFHVMLIGIYQDFLQAPLLVWLSGNSGAEPYIAPLAVAALSILTAMVFETFSRLLSQRRKHR